MTRLPVVRETLSHSLMSTFRLCRRRYHFENVLGIKLVAKAPALSFGTAAHNWLEAWFRDATLLVGVGSSTATQWTSAARAITEESLTDLDPFERAKLRAMVLGYHRRWASARWRVVAVELRFTAPIINPATGRRSPLYDLVGKIDAIVEILDGPDEGLWIVEHKTSAEDLGPASLFWDKLRMAPQAAIYMLGAEALGYVGARSVRGVIYDVLRKPKIEPLQATAKPWPLTQGTGCKLCGGKAGLQGTGLRGGDTHAADLCSFVAGGKEHGLGAPCDCGAVLVCPCAGCKGTGWFQPDGAPRPHAHVRQADETVGEYGVRCLADIDTKADLSYHRRVTVRTPDELTEARWDLWRTAQEIQAAKLATRDMPAGFLPGRNPDACFSFYRRCDYYLPCIGAGSIDDPTQFQIVGRHPELADAEESMLG